MSGTGSGTPQRSEEIPADAGNGADDRELFARLGLRRASELSVPTRRRDGSPAADSGAGDGSGEDAERDDPDRDGSDRDRSDGNSGSARSDGGADRGTGGGPTVLPWSTNESKSEAEAGGGKGRKGGRKRPARVRDLAERSHRLADEAEERERAAGAPRRRRTTRAGGRGGGAWGGKGTSPGRNGRAGGPARSDGSARVGTSFGSGGSAAAGDPAGTGSAGAAAADETPDWVSTEAPPEWATEGELPERVSALLQEWDERDAAAAERIAAGEEIVADDEAVAEEPPEPLTQQEAEQLARAVALRLLTAMPRTRHELSTKLLERDVPAEAVETVMDRFEEVGLLDDAAFAAAWVESRVRSKGFARGRLTQELRRKGVSAEHIAAALENLDRDEERERCEELALRRLGSRPLPPAGYGPDGAEREKVLRRVVGHLARKGYPQGMALACARRAMERHDGGER